MANIADSNNRWSFNTPVTLIVFNRPENTAQVFEAIRKIKPKQLFVIADGPRSDRLGEEELCAKTRAIIDTVDWDCKVYKNYSDINLGCRKRIGMTGLPWVFETVDETIVLEDDCLPHHSFFRFCQILLEKYRYDEKVLAICGTNHLKKWKARQQSYHFSDHFSAWGWATWKRVWDRYDINMQSWEKPEMKEYVKGSIQNIKRFSMYEKFLDETYNKKNSSWAYQMLYLGLSTSGLTIVPAQNLISNIGFGENATNTDSEGDIRANLPIYETNFPLKDPLSISVDKSFENWRHFRFFSRSITARIYRKIELLGRH